MTVLDDPVTTMPVLEHLKELRRRLLVCLLAAALGTTFAWFAYGHVFSFMTAPYRDLLLHHPTLNLSRGKLVVTAPLQGFTTRLKVCGYLGAGIAAPVVLFEAWRFLAPGLYRAERRYTASFMVAAVVLFGLGAVTAIAVFPKAVSWMVSVGGSGVVPLFSPGGYLGMYSLCCLVFGLAFTYPVVLVFLEVIRVLPSARLRRWRRHAIVLLVATAALVTPSNDPFSFLAMAAPLVAFYEASILIGRLLKR